MAKKSSTKKTQTPQKIDKKQLIVGIIILIVAILALAYAFWDMKFGTPKTAGDTRTMTRFVESKKLNIDPKHVSVAFSAEADGDLEYRVYYTTKETDDFTEDNSVSLKAHKGTDTYVITLPVESIARFRLDILNGKDVHIHLGQMRLLGTQTKDLSTFDQYGISSVREDLMVSDDKREVSYTILNELSSLLYLLDLIDPQQPEEEEISDTEEEVPSSEQAAPEENATNEAENAESNSEAATEQAPEENATNEAENAESNPEAVAEQTPAQ